MLSCVPIPQASPHPPPPPILLSQVCIYAHSRLTEVFSKSTNLILTIIMKLSYWAKDSLALMNKTVTTNTLW